MSEVKIGHCRPEQLCELIKIFHEYYPGNPRLQEIDYLNWQFRDNPLNTDGKYCILTAWSEEKPVSILGYTPIQIVMNEKIVVGGFTMLWRSLSKSIMGLVLLRNLLQQQQRLLSVGLSEATVSIYNKGRKPIGCLQRWVAVLNDTGLDFFKIADEKAKKVLLNSKLKIVKNLSSEGIYYIEKFEKGQPVDRLPFASCYALRDADYLNWRYVSIPKHNYKIIVDAQGNYGIYRVEQIMHENYSVIHIVEWVFPIESGKKALAKVVVESELNNSIVIDFYCSSREMGNNFREMGFVSEQELPQDSIPKLFRPINKGTNLLVGFDALDLVPIEYDDWYITRGDGDADRIKL